MSFRDKSEKQNLLLTIEEEDESSLEKVKNSYNKNERHLKALDLFFSGFVITPLVVFNWTSTWDIIYYSIFPDDFMKSTIASLIIGDMILVILYVIEPKLQHVQDSYQSSNMNKKEFYTKGFIMRSVYSYFMAVAYVCQWRGMWDFYAYYMDMIDWRYSLVISIIMLVLYLNVLNKSCKNNVVVTPFYLGPDTNLNDYFKKLNSYNFGFVSL